MSELTPKPDRGTMILVFGILGLVLCMPLGIVAWVMGNGDLKEMDAGRMDDSGRGLTQVGKILGMVSVILTIIGVAIWLLMVFLMVGAAAASGGGNAGLLVI